MEVVFRVIGEIQTKQRPRATTIGGYARIYTPKTTLNYENYIKECYLNSAKKQHFGNKPINVFISASFKAPKELSKYGESVKLFACMKHKDIDNIAKIVCDALNGVAYDDDKQIVNLTTQKCWTNGVEELYIVIGENNAWTDKRQLKLASLENELMDYCAENCILDDDTPDFCDNDETANKLQAKIDKLRKEIENE